MKVNYGVHIILAISKLKITRTRLIIAYSDVFEKIHIYQLPRCCNQEQAIIRRRKMPINYFRRSRTLTNSNARETQVTYVVGASWNIDEAHSGSFRKGDAEYERWSPCLPSRGLACCWVSELSRRKARAGICVSNISFEMHYNYCTRRTLSLGQINGCRRSKC